MQELAELHQLTPVVLTASKNDNPLAFLPIFEKRLFAFRKAFNPVLVYYSPLYFSTPERKLPGRELQLEYELSMGMGAFLRRNYKKVLLNLNTETLDVRGFKEAGLNAVPQYTFIRDLNAAFEIHRNEMTTLKKAEKRGFTFDAEFSPEALLQLIYDMYERKGHPFNINRNKLAGLLPALWQNGILKQYNVRDNGRIVSSVVVLADKGDTCYAWLAGADPEAMKDGASVFMYRELFSALRKDFRYLDLCGANSKGPSRLKAALGAELKVFFQVAK
jgi:hypothetical protein